MRRIVVGAALAAVGVLVLRALAPRLHARMLGTCERMFEEMPESFPPKRMLRGIEEISANSTRTLELLEERAQAREWELAGSHSPKTGRPSPRPVRVPSGRSRKSVGGETA
jgi:hypothetical protein